MNDLPKSLAANPRLSRWVEIRADGNVEVATGKVELGQGIATALAQIAAEELSVDRARVRLRRTRTDHSPREGFTAGSMSVADSGAALRHVCREVRALMIAEAARRAGAEPLTLTVVDGAILGDGHEVATYWDLADDVSLDRRAGSLPDAPPPSGGPDLFPRIDLPAKIFGEPRFLHDITMPGMLHGRVVRPPGPGARLLDAQVAETEALADVVAVVIDGDFLGVLTESEARAVEAADALREASEWKAGPALPDDSTMADWLTEQATDDDRVAASEPPPDDDVATYTARYFKPLLAHASIAPSCAIALWSGGRLQVWTHSQGVFELRDALAKALGIDEDHVVVEHVEGAGCYGHNPADDAAADAALLARRVPGRPVRVQWSRQDELAWDPFGSAMVGEVRATVSDGVITDWSYDVWSGGHTARPGYAGSHGLLGPSHRADAEPLPPSADPPGPRGHGSGRNADPGYGFTRRRVTSHRVLDMPVRTSALRSLGAFLNVFAIESSMDDIARAEGIDPVDFRLAHLTDERARAVVRTAAEAADWTRLRADGTGRGIGYARYKNRGAYCAVVAEVEATHEVRVRRLVVAVDVGRVVSADGVRNQIEGGAIQSTSWTLKERVRFGTHAVTSTDWETYPILRFSEIPSVEVHLLDRPDQPSVGSGEAIQGPVPAAIANALNDAIGVRVRSLPLTPEQIITSIES